MSLDLSSPNAKNRITLLQKGLPNKFRGEAENFQGFLYSFANFARNLAWTAEDDNELGVLDFTDPDSGDKIALHVDPSKVTPEMITAAHQARVQAVTDAEAAVITAESTDPPDEDQIKTTKLALIKAKQALSCEAEIMMLLDLSCHGSAHQILIRYQGTIKGNGVMAFKILNTKCNPSPLWGLENARNEIARHRTSLTLTDTAQNSPFATTTPPVRPAPQAPPGFRPRSTVPDAESERERSTPSPAVIADDLMRETTPSPAPAEPPQPRRTYDTRSTRRQATPRRSSRTTKGRTSRKYEEEYANLAATTANPPASLTEQFKNIRLQTGSSHPMCLLAQQNTDSPSLRQALLSEDAAEWEAALIKELENLEEIGTWEKVPKNKVPPTATILKSIWALKKKRLPSGKLLKYKARLCVRGDLQIKGDTVKRITTYFLQSFHHQKPGA